MWGFSGARPGYGWGVGMRSRSYRDWNIEEWSIGEMLLEEFGARPDTHPPPLATALTSYRISGM